MKYLSISKHETEVVKKIVEMKGKGRRGDEIAAALDGEGYRRANGEPVTQAIVSYLLVKNGHKPRKAPKHLKLA